MADWLNYHHLLYFATVVEQGGLVSAAKHLGVSHPTVSEQVHTLENHLGLSLFERRGRKLHPTENGRMVYSYAAQIFGIGDALLDAVEGRRAGRSILCRVGIDSVIPKLSVRRLLTPVLQHFGDALRLRCTESEREGLFAQLSTRQLDLVLTDSPLATTGEGELHSTMVSSSKLAIFAAPSLASRLEGSFPECLDEAPFLFPMPATRLRRELESWLGEHRIRPHVAAEMEDSGLLKAFGEEGHGVFAMPENVASEVCRQYGVTVLGLASVEAPIFAVTRTDENAAVSALLAAARGETLITPLQSSPR